MALLVLALLPFSVHPDDNWDERIDPACCPYPERDPRDYNWPFSHFTYSEIIPDVLGTFVPMTSVNITFGNTAVDYGKPIPPSVMVTAPAVTFALEPDRSERTLHTLMMVDPDVPFRDQPADGERVLWLVYDIPGNQVVQGKTLVEYAGPEPLPCPSGDRLCLPEHRVTFVLWEQPHGPLDLQPQDDAHIGAATHAGRLSFKARDFATRHELGLQLGMNFAETWYDEGDGRFGSMPWWHVSEDESLSRVGHLLPHAAQTPKRRAGKKDEL